jgi:hypothetical protein
MICLLLRTNIAGGVEQLLLEQSVLVRQHQIVFRNYTGNNPRKYHVGWGVIQAWRPQKKAVNVG